MRGGRERNRGLGGGGGNGGGRQRSGDVIAVTVGVHRLFRNWVGCPGNKARAWFVQVVAPNNVRAGLEAAERPEVEGARGGGCIEALVHIRLDLHLRPRVIPEPADLRFSCEG